MSSVPKRLPERPAPPVGARAIGRDPVERTMTDLLGHQRLIGYEKRGGKNMFRFVEETDGARTRFVYDDAGRLIARTDAAGRTTAYRYDQAGRLREVERPDGRIVDVRARAATYALLSDADGMAVEPTLPDGTVFDLRPPATAVEPFAEALEVDPMGNVVARDDQRFVYDTRGQLITAASEDGTVEYAYDAVGNRVARTGSRGTTRYRYDRADRLIGIDHAGGTREIRRYDADGALTARIDGEARSSYRYDTRQRLVEVRGADGERVRYGYGPAGRRILRQTADEILRFHHDGRGRLVAITDGDGAPRAGFTYDAEAASNGDVGHTDAGVTHAQVFGPAGPLGADPVRYRLLRDRLGSTRRILDARGRTVWEGQYAPFGRLLGEAPELGAPLPLFAGKLLDPTTGFYDFGARDYDPETGRFLQCDPWTTGPDDPRLLLVGQSQPPAAWLAEPRGAHPYLYCLNNPLSMRDPEGLGWVRAMFANILAFVWSSPWTLLGAGMTLIDWLFQFPLFGFAYLPSYGLRGAASGRIGSAAMLNVGGLFSSNLVLSNVLFGSRRFFDDLDDTTDAYVVPEDVRPSHPAAPVAPVLRTADTAYREHLLAHTIQSNFAGPFWPLVYGLGHDGLERKAVRESGFTRLAEPTLTLGPDKLHDDTGAELVVVGGQKPFVATVETAGAGAVAAFTDNAQFSQAHYTPLYVPGTVSIRVRDSRGMSDLRSLKIKEIKVKKVKLVRPGTLFLDEITDSRPVGVNDPQEPTVRLVGQQAVTLDFNIGPNDGRVFYDMHPAASLTLSRTTSGGDAQVTVTPAAAPPATVVGAHGIQELELRVRAWNAAGAVLQKVRVRSMAQITVMLQGHIVRRTDGTQPAITVLKQAQFLIEANRIWRQAGVRFQWRAANNFIDQTNLLVVDATFVAAGAGAGNIVSADLTALETFNPAPIAAPRPVPATDLAALHVYFIDSLSITGGSNIEAFANRGKGRLVIPSSARLASFAHEIGHLIGLQSPHPDQEINAAGNANAARQASKRLMNSTGGSEPQLISNREPRRTCATGHCQDETATARAAATNRMGP